MPCARATGTGIPPPDLRWCHGSDPKPRRRSTVDKPASFRQRQPRVIRRGSERVPVQREAGALEVVQRRRLWVGEEGQKAGAPGCRLTDPCVRPKEALLVHCPVQSGSHRLHQSPAQPTEPTDAHFRPTAPPCDIPSRCCFVTGPCTVTRSSLRMLRRVAAFCRPGGMCRLRVSGTQ